MKKILIALFFLLFLNAPAFAVDEDNSIIDELTKVESENIELNLNLESFQSCNALEDVMWDYVKSYWKNSKNTWYGQPRILNFAVDDVVMEADVAESAVQSKTADAVGWSVWDFSETNTQVDGVDESDIIKTDGKHIYYFNQTNKAIYIVKVGSLEVVKKINLPKTFYSPVLYIGNDRLVIVVSGYSQTDYSQKWYWINRNSKTYTIVFDTSDVESPKLLKLYGADGNLTKSRKIGDYLYVLSSNYFNIPYYNFKSEDDIEIDVNSIIPKHVDISKTSDTSKQNLTVKGKDLPYNLKSGNVAACNEIEYVFPDEDTMWKYNFNPSYNIVSIIDIENTEKQVKTKVIAGSNAEIYMSLDNLYMTSYMYTPQRWSCPPNAGCIAPWFGWDTTNTLIHKLNVDGQDVSYQDSTLVPGQPLNQYSMDEHEWNFRIITSSGWWEDAHTDLYILDEDLESVSSLEWLWKGERFQSSRFMWDKLFLVTFEQIDPFFAIDLSDQTNPTVLWELKIPGFSTYLHPYDENHIIGLGYDTKINQWGWTTTNWLKLDLYQINYDKSCGDAGLSADEIEKCDSGDYKWIIVKQLHTLTMWENGSYSEALNNPRMFVWNKARNTLLLPANLYVNDPAEQYQRIDFYNGLLSINISPENGIIKNAQTTHIDTSGLEEKRKLECSKYSKVISWEPQCKTLLDGTEYCTSWETSRETYAPNYCYENSPIGQYLANRSWQFNSSFIKRWLYAGNTVYAISDDKITSHTFDDELSDIKSVQFEK